MELTAKNVYELLKECSLPHPVPAEDEIKTVGHLLHFSRAKLEESRATIDELLAQLPAAFRAVGYGPDAGGGWSFLNAPVRADGVHWGEQRAVDLLLGLGLAIGSVEWGLPRHLWHYLPGGMPYFQINPPRQLLQNKDSQ